MVTWIKILYTDISSCVGSNGFYSGYFNLTIGIRQGCPISALLFLIVAEIIAIRLRENNNIKGLIVNGSIFKIKLLADDTSLILKDMKSVELAIREFEYFGKFSGLQINLDKTEIIPIGSNSSKHIAVPDSLSMINIKIGPFKTLGIWFSKNPKDMVTLNFNKRIENIKKILFTWNSRTLSLKGRITIIKALVFPQILFLFNLIYVPKEIFDQINKEFLNFLWRNKPPKIKKETIIGQLEDGGLKMIDVYNMHVAAKCGWIKRLVSNKIGSWKKLFFKMLSINQNIQSKRKK